MGRFEKGSCRQEGFHFDRVVGGNHHYRHFGGHFVPRVRESA